MRRKKRKLTFKRSNLATWGEDEVNSSNEEEKDEEALLCLMILDQDPSDLFDFNFSTSSNDEDDIDDLYHELYDSLVRAKKKLKSKIVEINSLVQKVDSLEKENHNLNLLIEQLLTQNKSFAKCKLLKNKKAKLTNLLQGFTNSKKRLHVMLENQTNLHNKSGLSYQK